MALPLIIGIALFSPDNFASSLAHDASSHAHHAADDFHALSFESEQPFDTEAFQRFPEQLPINIFRAKGVLKIDGSNKRYIMTSVLG